MELRWIKRQIKKKDRCDKDEIMDWIEGCSRVGKPEVGLNIFVPTI